MPIKYSEINENARGGTELTTRALERKLQTQYPELLDFFDIYPSRVRDFDPTRPSIYVAHDLPGDPEADHLKDDKGKRFNALVFVSDWQYAQYFNYYGLSGENSVVIKNGFEPIELPKESKWDSAELGTRSNPLRLIYHTTPHRGLQLLVPVFAALWQKYIDRGIHIRLDVYSSFSIYGWAERDEVYAELFKQIEEHPAMYYHGARPNDEVREALTKSHIFAYPCIWQETFCIAAVEAMSAGNLIVHSNLAALPETTGGLCFSYPMQNSLQANADRFYSTLDSVIGIALNNPDAMKNITNLTAIRVNSLYSWDAVLPQWVNTLSYLKSTVAS